MQHIKEINDALQSPRTEAREHTRMLCSLITADICMKRQSAVNARNNINFWPNGCTRQEQQLEERMEVEERTRKREEEVGRGETGAHILLTINEQLSLANELFL